MLVTKTKAAELAGVSRRTFYNHIPQKKISLTVDDEGNEKIDLSELERIYGKETIAKNLKELEDQEESVSESESSRATAQGSVKYELLLLKERIKGLEESKYQLESHNRREREQLQDEIENLRDSLKKAQEHHSQLSLLLTNQSKDTAGQKDEETRRIEELEKTVQELRKMNGRVLQELKSEKSKTIWQRLFG